MTALLIFFHLSFYSLILKHIIPIGLLCFSHHIIVKIFCQYSNEKYSCCAEKSAIIYIIQKGILLFFLKMITDQNEIHWMGDTMRLILERLTERDVPQLIRLSDSVGWDYDAPEIQTIFTAGQIFGHRNQDGEIVSSAAIIPYSGGLASIGMVIVHPNYRGLGLGKSVTKACIATVRDDVTIMLIATNEGKPLYESLGFQSVSYVKKYICERFIQSNYLFPSHHYEMDLFNEEFFQEIVDLDRQAVGADRDHFLRTRIKQSETCFVIKDSDKKIIGFGLSIKTPANLVLGPIVAPHDDLAIALIDLLSEGHNGKVRIDVPQGKESFFTILEKRGFHKVSQPPIMVLNSDKLPPRNGHLYGIAAQIFG
jgi:ribosomal protein S18 acetylase RimI-like enzyme